MKTSLLLVDLQNDYFPGGAMELVGIDEAAENARLLLNAARAAGVPVIHVQHLAARPGATFFIPCTDGARIHPTLAPREEETVMVKHFPNSFRDTPLLDLLRDQGSERLIICGAMSHMCIDATTRAAFDLGFACVVAEDACATRDLAFQGTTVRAAQVHAAFMAALAVPYATVVSTQDALAAMA